MALKVIATAADALVILGLMREQVKQKDNSNHITKSKEPETIGDLLNLESDAEHQSEKSEHPV